MWLAPVLLLVLVLAVIGGLVVGGIYALILIPIALVVVLVGLFGAASARFGQRRPPQDQGPHHASTAPATPNVADAPSTPSDLVDARREAQ